MLGLSVGKSESEGWVGCAARGGQLALALVQPGGRDGLPRVRWVADEPWSQPERTLKRLKRRLQPHGRVLLLARGQYLCQTLDAPADVPREDWADAVRWTMKDMVEFGVDDAAIDVLAIPESTSYRDKPQCIAVVADAAVMRPIAAHGVHASLRWHAVDIVESALRNLSARLEPEGRAQAVLHCEPGQATLIVTWQGELLFARQLELNLYAEADAPVDADAHRRALDHAGLELQRTLDSIERSFGQVTLARVLVTPMPRVQAIADGLGALLYVPVQAMNLDDALDWTDVPHLAADPAALNRHLPAIGAALRDAPALG